MRYTVPEIYEYNVEGGLFVFVSARLDCRA